MQTLNRTHLPVEIKIKGSTYKKDAHKSACHQDKRPFDSKGCILVKVLATRLKSQTNAYGKPYQPTEWIYAKQASSAV